MKIFFYTDENELVDQIDEAEAVEIIKDDEIKWAGGGMGGIKPNFYISPDDDLEWDQVTDEMKLQALKDRKARTMQRAKEEAINRIPLIEPSAKADMEFIFDFLIEQIRQADSIDAVRVADQLESVEEIETEVNQEAGTEASPDDTGIQSPS